MVIFGTTPSATKSTIGTIGQIVKLSRNTSTFESSVDVPKSLNDSKADMSNSVVSTTTSVCTTGKAPFLMPFLRLDHFKIDGYVVLTHKIYIIPFLESLSSIALLDSKILAPPDDPDDIFGMGNHWKDTANGMKRYRK